MKACVEEEALKGVRVWVPQISPCLFVCVIISFCLPGLLCLEFENEGMLRMQEAVILAMNTLMTTTSALFLFLFK
jgi:hypothetical protein